ncbi:MAG: exosome complex RNA-binding protein Rrp4, partial [Candidatus Bathyarchaeia archaeon]
LRARYFPLVDDTVIGQITDIGLHGWTVDINAPYSAMLSLSDVVGRSFNPQMESLSNILGVGDVIVGKVTIFDRTRDPHITIQAPGLGRVSGGVVIGLTPTKIPRLIGKQGSMISLLKQGTGCDVIVGQNGKVLIRGREQKDIEIVIKAINLIESSSHLSGLTDRIKVLLENEKRR